MKILVKGPNWIGDTVMLTPLLVNLKKLAADAHITVMVKKGCAQVLKNIPEIDEIWINNEKESWGAYLKTLSELKKRKFDIGILSPNSFSSALLFFLGRVKNRIGYDRDGRGFLLSEKIKLTKERVKMHQVEYYLELLTPIINSSPNYKWDNELTDDDKSLVYKSTEEERAKLADYLKAKNVSENACVVAINPGGAFGPSKRWLTDRYAKVADFIADRYKAKIFITGSPPEGELFKEIRAAARCDLIDATQDMDIRLMGAFLERCNLMVTNDSGPMHMGAAAGTPMIAIFGPTSPECTSPRSKKSIVIYKKPDCSPCFQKVCPIDHKCMTWVDVDEVTQHVVKIFEKKIFEIESIKVN